MRPRLGDIVYAVAVLVYALFLAWVVRAEAQAPRFAHQACVARGMIWDLPRTNDNAALTPLTDLAGTRIYVVPPGAPKPASPSRMVASVAAPPVGATGGPYNCQEGLTTGDYDILFTGVDFVGNESTPPLRVQVDNTVPSSPTGLRLGP